MVTFPNVCFLSKATLTYIININSRLIMWLTPKGMLAFIEVHPPCGLVNSAYFFHVVLVLGVFQEIAVISNRSLTLKSSEGY